MQSPHRKHAHTMHVDPSALSSLPNQWPLAFSGRSPWPRVQASDGRRRAGSDGVALGLALPVPLSVFHPSGLAPSTLRPLPWYSALIPSSSRSPRAAAVALPPASPPPCGIPPCGAPPCVAPPCGIRPLCIRWGMRSHFPATGVPRTCAPIAPTNPSCRKNSGWTVSQE